MGVLFSRFVILRAGLRPRGRKKPPPHPLNCKGPEDAFVVKCQKLLQESLGPDFAGETTHRALRRPPLREYQAAFALHAMFSQVIRRRVNTAVEGGVYSVRTPFISKAYVGRE